uniref:Uncharacterized protein n=1 Tax=Rhizophora mucronata TaxID=61149 RepID=A0A2P2PMH3_RHIMU
MRVSVSVVLLQTYTHTYLRSNCM